MASLQNIKQEINNNPELKALVEEGKNVDSSQLPFQTKEEATRVLIKKFNINDVQELQSKTQDGLTAEEKQEIYNQIESTLTEEGIVSFESLGL